MIIVEAVTPTNSCKLPVADVLPFEEPFAWLFFLFEL